MRRMSWLLACWAGLGVVAPAMAEESKSKSGAAPALSAYLPPPESRGGWRSLLPERGRARRRRRSRRSARLAGVDWDRLRKAWEHNASAPGATGLIVIRRGHVVGEWYRGGDRDDRLQHLLQQQVVH